MATVDLEISELTGYRRVEASDLPEGAATGAVDYVRKLGSTKLGCKQKAGNDLALIEAELAKAAR